MEDLVNKFTSGNSVASKYQIPGRQSYDNPSVRERSSERKLKKSASKDRRITDIDKMSQEVDRQLKAQRKKEKDNIKKFGHVYS